MIDTFDSGSDSRSRKSPTGHLQVKTRFLMNKAAHFSIDDVNLKGLLLLKDSAIV